jgi:hypothetical protein
MRRTHLPSQKSLRLCGGGFYYYRKTRAIAADGFTAPEKLAPMRRTVSLFA